MSPTSRRGFLGFMAALAAGSLFKLRGESVTEQPAAATFPFLKHYQPFPPGQPIFERVGYEPSFLHPNGNWVMLPNPSGHFDLWDWRIGIPVEQVQGTAKTDNPTDNGPCIQDREIEGCFCAEGEAWIWRVVGIGGNDANELRGAPLRKQGAWSVYTSNQSVLDPYRPLIHELGPMSDTNSLFLFDRSVLDGKSQTAKQLPADKQGIISFDNTMVSSDGRWLLCHHPAEPDETWWSVWSLPHLVCRAYKRAPSPKNPDFGFNLDGSRCFLTDVESGSYWDWTGHSSTTQGTINLGVSAFGPDRVQADKGRIILERKGSGVLEVKDSKGGSLIRRLLGFPPNTQLVAFSPDSKRVLAAPPSGEAWLWDPAVPCEKIPGEFTEFLEKPWYRTLSTQEVRALALSKDGRWVAVGSSSGEVNLFQTETEEIQASTPSETSPPEATEEEQIQAEPSPSPAPGTYWSVGSVSDTWNAMKEPIRALAFSKSSLAMIGMNGQVAIWDLDKKTCLNTWKAHPNRANTLQITKDGRFLFTGGLDGVQVWSLPEGKWERCIGPKGQAVACIHLGHSEDQLAVSYLDGRVALYEWARGRKRWEAQGHSDVAEAVAIHPSGKVMASHGWDGVLAMWNMEKGTVIKKADIESGCLAWSPDGTSLAVGGNRVELFPLDLSEKDAALDFMWDADCT